jgi:hypothetical protein
MTSFSSWAYLANIYRQHLEFSYLQPCLLVHFCESWQFVANSAFFLRMLLALNFAATRVCVCVCVCVCVREREREIEREAEAGWIVEKFLII